MNKQEFDDFRKRLHFHVVGNGVSDHYTSSATFIVKEKRYVTGIDLDFDPDQCIVDCDNTYCFDPHKYIDELYDDSIDSFKKFISEECNISNIEAASDYELFKAIAEWDDQVTHTGYFEEWRYVNHHFTMEAAEAFIERKKHDYIEMMVYVDSQYYCQEYNKVINGIIDGSIGYVE